MKDELNIQPILLDSRQAASACGLSLSLFYALDAEGKLPQGCKLHSKKMYSVARLRLWADNGMPARDSDKWAALIKGNGQ